MIDVSDGLLADLDHICETSHVAAIVELERLPLSPAARHVVAAEPGIQSRLVAGGDDYELLFAAPADAAERIAALSSQLGLPITMIGRIEAGAGVRLVDAAGQIIAVEAIGYRHF
jgi:thiamine-monophosphate kinase